MVRSRNDPSARRRLAISGYSVEPAHVASAVHSSLWNAAGTLDMVGLMSICHSFGLTLTPSWIQRSAS